MWKRNSTLAIPVLLTSFLSCASLQVTTWVLREGTLVHGVDRKTALEAEGYRCYSEPDDTAWRTQLDIETACCGK